MLDICILIIVNTLILKWIVLHYSLIYIFMLPNFVIYDTITRRDFSDKYGLLIVDNDT